MEDAREAHEKAERVEKRFRAMVEGEGLLHPGEMVVAGVSGGPDSLALLHLLTRLREDPAWCIVPVAAHLDHGMRAESAGDADFVARAAADWGVESLVGAADVPALSRRAGLSMEEAARVARYRFLGEAAHGRQAAVVAVGHNADDQAETVLMHWLRGAGLAGLRGMLPLSSLQEMRLEDDEEWSSAAAGMRLIRPLLTSTREEINAYCRVWDLSPRFDLSNSDQTFFRNRLRHNLLPYLELFNPNIRAVLCRSAGVVARDYDYLRRQTLMVWEELAQRDSHGGFRFERLAWAGLHPSLQAGLLREAVRRLRRGLRNIHWVHIEDALRIVDVGRVGSAATLPGGLMLRLDYGHLWIGPADAPPLVLDYPQMEGDLIPVPAPGRLSLGRGWLLEAEIHPAGDLAGAWERNDDPWAAYLDLKAAETGPLCLRRRRPGDLFQPLGMGGRTKGVRELMIGERVPAAARAGYPLLTAGEVILWVPGMRPDQRARVRPETEQVLVLRLTRADKAKAREENNG